MSFPGPGNRGGNFPVLPASKEAESPSNLFYVDSMRGGVFRNQKSPNPTGGGWNGMDELLGLSASLLAGRTARFPQLLPGPGQQNLLNTKN